MRARVLLVAVTMVAAMAFGGFQASADGKKRLTADLSGFEEVPTLSVAGTGRFVLDLVPGGTSLAFTLTYSGLTGDATAAHIHLGKPAIAGGVIAALCGGVGQSDCPVGTSATISGTIDASTVVGPAAQGIEPGEFAELLGAIQAGATYVNVHTVAFPPGEIRGQIG